MFAVYGIKRTKREIEKFIGYLEDSFFDDYLDASGWEIALISNHRGGHLVGRLYGRAFFVELPYADKEVLESYLNATLVNITDRGGE